MIEEEVGTTVVFETAALSDALKKAARIAPLKGKAGDLQQCAGVYLEIRGGEDPHVMLRVTDRSVFYTEKISALSITGDDTDWRLPSAVTAGVVAALPAGSGKTCKFEQVGGRVRITSGRTKAHVVTIATDGYPDWDLFDIEDMNLVKDIGARLEQVAWAVERNPVVATSSVYMDGENLVGTNGDRMVSVPLEIPMDEDNILVHIGVLGNILASMPEIYVSVRDGYLCMLPNDFTQIKCLLMGLQFPKVSSMFNLQFDDVVMFNREHVLEIMNRIMPVISKDRQADLFVVLGNGEMELFAEDDGKMNSILDMLELPGQCDHQPLKFRFDPDNFRNAISKAPGAMVVLNYNAAEKIYPVRVDGQDDYRCWIMPRM